MPKIQNPSLFDEDALDRKNLESTINLHTAEVNSDSSTNNTPRIVSPSLIGTLSECPRCLWRHYNEGIKRPDGIFPSLPSGMDGVIKKYFDTFRSKSQLPPEIKDEIKGTLFTDLVKLNPWRSNWKGISHIFNKYNFLLRGAIDELIVSPEGEFIPFDFKTRGYDLKDDTHLHYQTQLDMYALLFNKNDYKTANYGYLLFFWPAQYANSQTKFNTKLIKMDLDPERGLRLLKSAYEILAGSKPKASNTCQYCAFRREKK